MASTAKKTSTIMIIDDEPSLLYVIEQMLQDGGHSVISASSSSDALNVYKNRHAEVDVVISDLAMPVMNGENLFKEFKKINPEVKMLIMTGFVDAKGVASLRQQGVAGFLDKPFKGEDVLKMIDSLA